MASKRKVKRTLVSAILLWIGRLLLHRVQRRTLQAVTGRPQGRFGRLKSRAKRAAGRPSTGPAAKSHRLPRPRVSRRAAKGIGLALISTAAAAAMKAGVSHVIESERNERIVTPDFDVFADDEQ